MKRACVAILITLTPQNLVGGGTTHRRIGMHATRHGRTGEPVLHAMRFLASADVRPLPALCTLSMSECAPVDVVRVVYKEYVNVLHVCPIRSCHVENQVVDSPFLPADMGCARLVRPPWSRLRTSKAASGRTGSSDDVLSRSRRAPRSWPCCCTKPCCAFPKLARCCAAKNSTARRDMLSPVSGQP